MDNVDNVDNRIRDLILTDILKERERQQELWGNTFDDLNTPNDWATYINNYVSKAVYDGREQIYTSERFKENMLKAVAIGVAAIETIDRNGKLAKRHYDKEQENQV